MIPESAVEAAWDSILERGRTGSIDYTDLKAALEAAAPIMHRDWLNTNKQGDGNE